MVGKRLHLPKSADFGLLRPYLTVETSGEVLIQDGTVDMVDDSAQSIPYKKTSDGEAYKETDQGDDRHPFLSGILLIRPWPFNFSLSNSS